MSAIVFIPLTQGKVAVIDFEDFEKVRPFKWCARNKNGCWYAFCHKPGSGKKGEHLHLHRHLLDAPPRTPVHHWDGDGLNCQRYNLCICSPVQNSRGFKRKRAGASSQFRGVSWHKGGSFWVAKLVTEGKTLNLGVFHDEEDAARAYDKKAIELFGKYAAPNFPV